MKGYFFWLGLPAGVLAKDGYDNPRLYSGDVIRFRLLLFNKLLVVLKNGVQNHIIYNFRSLDSRDDILYKPRR